MTAPETFDGPLLGGRYRLGAALGRGGQGETFLARDEGATGQPTVVVKQLRLRGAQGWKKFDLFEREVQALRSIEHPAIPRYLDSFESEGGVHNLVMARAPGDSLALGGGRRAMDDAALIDVLRQVLAILVHLHGLAPSVVHRDIKPANLVRAPDGRIALVDFGGVRDATRGGGSTMIGTFGYMAPEQLHGQSSPASDLYALGATIVALAGGVEPEDVPRLGLKMDLARHLHGRDARLIGLLGWMTAPDPTERPQRAADVLAELDAATARATSTSSRRPARGPDAAPRADDAAPLHLAVSGAIERGVARFDAFARGLPGPLRVAADLGIRVVVAWLGMITFMLRWATTYESKRSGKSLRRNEAVLGHLEQVATALKHRKKKGTGPDS